MGAKLNLLNMVFDRLTVSEYSCMKNNNSYWKCICQCGNEVIVKGAMLKYGHTKSCGCLRWDNHKQVMVKHGQCESAEYNAWCKMKERCYNKNIKMYKHYGGRGIVVCDRWLNSFENFLSDMGLRPSPQHSLDRFPNINGIYEPENCRWATKTEQSRNTRKTTFVTYLGETKSITEWCERLNISPSIVRSRISSGWRVDTALTTQSGKSFQDYLQFLETKRLKAKTASLNQGK